MRAKYKCDECRNRECILTVESERDYGTPDCCPYDNMVEVKWRGCDQDGNR